MRTVGQNGYKFFAVPTSIPYYVESPFDLQRLTECGSSDTV